MVTKQIKTLTHQLLELTLKLAVFVCFFIYVPNFLSSPVSRPPYFYDQDNFFTIFHQLSLNASLYSEVYDHKDFIFFYIYGCAYYIWGANGPIILETALSISILYLLFRLWHILKLEWYVQFLLSALFILYYFSERVYAPVLTYHLGCFFYLCALISSLNNKPKMAGALLAAMIFTKMSLVPLAGSVVWAAFYCLQGNGEPHAKAKAYVMKWWAKLVLATTAVTSVFMAILSLRDEFNLYWTRAVYYNLFEYEKLGGAYVIRFLDIFLATFGTWWAIGLCAMTGIAMLLAIYKLLKKNADTQFVWAGMITLIGGGTLVILYKVHRGYHHFDFAGLTYILLIGFAIALFAQTIINPAKMRLLTMAFIGVVGILPLLLSPSLLNHIQNIQLSQLNYLTKYQSMEEIDNPMYTCLNDNGALKPNNGFMILNAGTAGMVSSEKASCRFIFYLPWASDRDRQDLFKCIESPRIKWLIQGPFPMPVPEFEMQFASAVKQNFEQVATCNASMPVTLWRRK